MRSRSRGSMEPIEGAFSQTTSSCSTSNGTITIAGAQGKLESMLDVSNSNFHRRLARGEIVVNPMYKSTTERSSGGTTASYSSPGSPCTQSISWENGVWHLNSSRLGLVERVNVPGIDTSQLANLAGTEASANVAGPEFAGAQFIAELRETIQLLRNPFGALASIGKRARRAKRKHSSWRNRTVRDYVSANWLQYRYGIMPLVYSSQDIVKALESLAHRKARYTARGSASDSGSATRQDSYTGTWICTRDVLTQRDVTARVGIIYEHDFSSTFGLRARDVPGAVWEIVPFSFVLDWFFNIGDFIEAIVPKGGVQVLGSWTTLEDKHTTQGDTSSVFNQALKPNSTSLSDPTSLEVLTQTAKQRSRGHRIAIATKPLPFNGNLGKKRVLDALSLVQQVFLSK